ncbi:DUF169 domain-containing protein [uncultured Desulfobacter sp.]|uniref:DUF169 domain-containing protein n=1 Tax=uncultured Desulfobacter sp. TaxID=240139 RepID=UPI002AAA8882|nr:DUF169 domain-containing protein [uncultured Desulfobacter sp.]
MNKKITAFLDILGLDGPVMGLFYTDQIPESGITPKPMTHIDLLSPDGDHEINWSSCLLSKVRYARRKMCPAFFDKEHYGCLGAAFFTGFKPFYESFEPALISSGIQGQMQGERYVDCVDTGKRIYDSFKPPGADAAVLVIQPLDLFASGNRPEIVLLFPNRDSLIGLNALTVFVTGNPDAVKIPFGMGCAALVSWPRKFKRKGDRVAVIGGFDINGIKYFKKGEFSFAVSYDLFLQMVDAWPDSMVGTRAWKRLKKQ